MQIDKEVSVVFIKGSVPLPIWLRWNTSLAEAHSLLSPNVQPPGNAFLPTQYMENGEAPPLDWQFCLYRVCLRTAGIDFRESIHARIGDEKW